MQDFLKKARERPELTGLATTYSASTQQLRADVDREKATLLGMPIQDVYSAIQAQFGSLTVSQYNLFCHVWWVIVQSDAPYRQKPDDLTRLYTRNNQNQMVPLSSVVTTQLDGRARTCCRTSTASPRPRSSATRRPATAPATRSRRWRRSRARCCRPATRSPGRAWRSRKSSRAAPRRSPSSSGCSSCSWCSPRSTSRGRCRARVMTAVPFGDPRRAAHQPPARAGQRRVLPDRPAGADRPGREERGAARVRGGRVPQAGQVDHGGDAPGRRAAPAADHHDLARLRGRLPAAGASRSAPAPMRAIRSAPASSAACSARPRWRCCTCRCSSTSSTGWSERARTRRGRHAEARRRAAARRRHPRAAGAARGGRLRCATRCSPLRCAAGAGRLHGRPGLQAPGGRCAAGLPSTSRRTRPTPPTRSGGSSSTTRCSTR